MFTSLLLLTMSTADAATVAVLPFDGYGATWADVQTATQGLRDAFLAEQGLNPLTDTDISEGLTGSGELADARQRVADARRAYQGRRAEEALALVDEGLDLHYQALSDVARRPEMADAWYLKALCLYALQRDDEASEAFMETAFLFPKYLKDRATALPTGAISLAAGAQAAMETGRKRVRTSDSVREIGAALNVEYVVIGWVTGEGDVVTRVYDEGTFVAEERARLGELPALPVDDAYGTLAHALARDLRVPGSSMTATRPTSRPDQAEAARLAAEEAERAARAAQSSRESEDSARDEQARRREEDARRREEEARQAETRDAASRAARDRAAREEEERQREEDARQREEDARQREEDARASADRRREAEEREADDREAAEREAEEREAAEREAEEREADERQRQQEDREEEERRRAAEEREAEERAERERDEAEARERAREAKEEERAQARAEKAANPGACAGDEAPVTCKWWFWAATAGGAGGISALLGYAAYEPPPTEVEGPPTWSVEISN